jgi:amidase
MAFDAYEEHDACALAALVRAGDVAPEALLDAAQARIDERNPALNAVVAVSVDAARRELAARRAAGTERTGLLAGVPVLVKDLLSMVAGMPTCCGNRLLRERAPPAAADSTFVARLRAAGALIVGKTNTPEFGLTPTTEPEAFDADHRARGLRSDAQPLGPGAQRRRLEWWLGGGGRGRDRAAGHRR